MFRLKPASRSTVFCAPIPLIFLSLVLIQDAEPTKNSTAENQAESAVPFPNAQTTEQSNAQQIKPDDIKPTVVADGPIHESFADVERSSHLPNDLIELTPPIPIKESQSKSRPKGKNVIWIGGYWYWDPIEERFAWVSGAWRAVPPGQKWTDGYWQTGKEGSRWISGFWNSKDAPTHEFLRTPPPSLEFGPRKGAPGNLHFYCRGNWEFDREADKYVWREGRWHLHELNWRWIPADYIWTPRGHVFSNGYWDYKLQERGCAFESVYFIVLDDSLDPLRAEDLDRIQYRPTQQVDLTQLKQRMENANLRKMAAERLKPNLRRDEQREDIQRNRDQIAKEQERQRQRAEMNSNLNADQRRQIQMARQQRAQVDRAREIRREAAQAPNPPSTEQLRLQNQRESIQRNRERFRRNQERTNRRGDQTGNGRNKNP